MKTMEHGPLRRTALLLATGTLAATALAACGDDADDSGDPYDDTSPDTTTSAPTTPTETDSTPAGDAETITTAESDLGTYLTDDEGLALYLWEADTGGESTCTDACAEAWPPVVTEGEPQADGDVEAELLGTVEREDGSTQVTYDGQPLYYFVQDTAEGDTNGQGSDGFGALWWLVAPDGAAITGMESAY